MVLVTRLLVRNMSTSSTGYGCIYLSWEQPLPLLSLMPLAMIWHTSGGMMIGKSVLLR